MITPILERLILEGKATFKTHNHGASGVGTIPNPNGKTIIVTDIIYHPFVDHSEENLSIQDILDTAGFVHTLKLQSKQNICNWTFKDSYKLIGEYSTPERPTLLNTFFVATDNIHINIKRFSSNGSFTFGVNDVPNETNEESYPLGYGKTIEIPNQVKSVLLVHTSKNEFGADVNIVPLGKRFNNVFLNENNVKHDFTAELSLNIPAENYEQIDYNTYPLITFQYVELNDKYSIANILNNK